MDGEEQVPRKEGVPYCWVDPASSETVSSDSMHESSCSSSSSQASVLPGSQDRPAPSRQQSEPEAEDRRPEEEG